MQPSATDICKSLASSLALIGEIPPSPDEFRHRFKALSTRAVKRAFTELARAFDMTAEFDVTVPHCKENRPMEFDIVCSHGNDLCIAGESEWLFQIDKMAYDFRKLPASSCPTKVFINRRDWRVVLPSLAQELAHYPLHVIGEEYVFVQATDYHGNLLAHTFTVPETTGRLKVSDIVLRTVPGSPFPWFSRN